MKSLHMAAVGLGLLVACGGGDDSAATAAEAAIVGDWFMCMGADCAELMSVGARYTADGRWFELRYREARDRNDRPPQPLEGEPYCVAYERGTYEYDPEMGTLTFMAAVGGAAPARTPWVGDGGTASAGSIRWLRVRENATGTWTKDAIGHYCDVSAARQLRRD